MSSGSLNISEIFYSLQGEGLYCGRAAVFVRFSGCSMGCPWCDSKYAQKTNFILTPQQILQEVKKYNCPLVIITGGEPCEQDLSALLSLLYKNGFEIHLETNGSIDTDTSLIKCVTVSPKKNPDENMLKKADVIKCVIDGAAGTEQTALSYLKYLKKGAEFFIQPEGNKQENIEKCLNLIKQNPKIRLSVQLHKMLKIK